MSVAAHVVEAHGARIPLVGLGTWELRGRVCTRIVEQALRLGYRHIDTAQMYDNERDVGEGVRASGKRSEVTVTTKVQPSLLAPHDLGSDDAELVGEGGAELAAKIGHAGKVGDPALVDPLEQLPPVETRVSHRLERLLELGELHLREIVTVVGDHWLLRGPDLLLYRGGPAQLFGRGAAVEQGCTSLHTAAARDNMPSVNESFNCFPDN